MDLNARLFEIVNANISKGKSTRSINELIVEILQDGREYTRPELTTAVAQLRYEDANGKITDETLAKPEFVEEFKKYAITAKNGVDTSISHSNNNSSFHYNEAFKMWKLLERGGKYRLEAVKPAKS